MNWLKNKMGTTNKRAPPPYSPPGNQPAGQSPQQAAPPAQPHPAAAQTPEAPAADPAPAPAAGGGGGGSMFAGLSVRNTPEPEPAAASGATPQADPSPAPAAGGGGGLFSGLNVAADTPDPANTSTGSGFSFLNNSNAGGGSTDDLDPLKQQSSEPASAFGFIGGGASAADEPLDLSSLTIGGQSSGEPAAAATPEPAGDSQASGFSFIGGGGAAAAPAPAATEPAADPSPSQAPPRKATATKKPLVRAQGVKKKKRMGLRPGYAGRQEEGQDSPPASPTPQTAAPQPVPQEQPRQTPPPRGPSPPPIVTREPTPPPVREPTPPPAREPSPPPPAPVATQPSPEAAVDDEPRARTSSLMHENPDNSVEHLKYQVDTRLTRAESGSTLASATEARGRASSAAVEAEPAAIERRVSAVLSNMQQSLQRLNPRRVSGEGARVRITTEQRRLLKELAGSRKTIIQKEEEQARAIDQENFEQAGELDAQVDSLKEHISSVKAQFYELSEEYDLAETELLSVQDEEVRLRKECMESLRTLKKLVNTQKDEFLSTAHTRIDKVQKKIDEEADRLSRLLGDLDDDLQATNEEEATIRASIDEETKDIVARKFELSAKRSELESEIAALYEQIAAKEKEMGEAADGIAEADGEIAAVEANYKSDLDRLSNIMEGIRQSQEARDAERSAHESQKSAQEEDISQTHQTEATYVKTSTGIADKIEEVSLEAASLNNKGLEKRSYVQRRNELLDVRSKGTNDLDRLKTDLTQINAQIENLTSDVSKLQTEIARLKQSVAFIDGKQPDLEAEKAALVQSRSFKEAARIKAEIQANEAQKESDTALITKNESSLAQQEKGLESKKKLFLETQKKLARREYQADMDRLQLLKSRVNDLEPLLDEAREMDNELDAEFIQSFITAVNGDIHELEQKHNVDSSASLCAPSETSETPATGAVEEQVVDDEAAPEADAEPVAEEEPVSAADYDGPPRAELEARLTQLESDINAAVENEEYERAAELEDERADVEGLLARAPAAVSDDVGEASEGEEATPEADEAVEEEETAQAEEDVEEEAAEEVTEAPVAEEAEETEEVTEAPAEEEEEEKADEEDQPETTPDDTADANDNDEEEGSEGNAGEEQGDDAGGEEVEESKDASDGEAADASASDDE